MFYKYVILNKRISTGLPYEYDRKQLLDPAKRKWVYLPVYKCFGPDGHNAYTVIRAQRPENWGLDVNIVC